MKKLHDIADKILTNGSWKTNRTGVKTLSVVGEMFQHDMKDGFPIATTKQVAMKTAMVELEGFLNGVTSKKWYQDRGCHIWDEWCNPQKIPYSTDKETQEKMKNEDDLGRIYGAQWTAFGKSESFDGINQVKRIVDTLKTNPEDRRMICTAWNPLELNQMALPPCHYSWHVVVTGEKLDTLNLTWNQRSVDFFLGSFFNIVSYAMLLKLLAKEANMKEGILTGFWSDLHIYENHLDQVETLLERTHYDLPDCQIKNFTSIYDWTHKDYELIGYKHHPKITAPVAV
jgi:thymidylate synthase